jgi:hypothetical protein
VARRERGEENSEEWMSDPHQTNCTLLVEVLAAGRGLRRVRPTHSKASEGVPGHALFFEPAPAVTMESDASGGAAGREPDLMGRTFQITAWTILVAVLAPWIAGNRAAGDPDSAPKPVPGGLLWSLKPLRKPALPEVRETGWPRNPLDRFVLARLEAKGLRPSPEAGRAVLIRRLSFDLLGLPPAPEEIETFVNDGSAGAYSALVERLLASPRYGERWARHWLDLARYTESQGFEYDRLRQNGWHYRDYVIQSFNEDKPYDRFVREQIAGDVLEPVTSAGIIATSFLVCGPWDEAGNSQANQTQRAITREEEMEDLVSVVSQTFLGMTVNCARCHAHKFDPIPQEDYYRMRSVFDGVHHGENPIAPPAELRAQAQRAAALAEEIAGIERQIEELEGAARSRFLQRRKQPTAAERQRPAPLSRWSCEPGAKVSGSLEGELHGGASLAGGRLILDGKDGYLESQPLPRDLAEKTLEVWLSLPTLEQGGGGAITIQSRDGGVFDSIVFAERQPRRWIAGSSGYARTRDLSAPEETARAGELIHLAVVYQKDGTIEVYRNGRPHGEPYRPGSPLQTYRKGDARVLLGMRHTGGARPFLKAEIAEAALYDRPLSAAEVAASFETSRWSVKEEEMVAALSAEERGRREALLPRLERVRAERGGLPAVKVSYCGIRKEPAPARRLNRGDVGSPAEEVAPGALSAVSEPPADFGLPPGAPEAMRRIKLAEWITDPRNPLTARVMVNRIWQYHFGQGIVATPSDFGSSGKGPSHPELLDWLAAAFIEDGFSVKALHRRIVGSAAYRQASSFEESAASVDAEDSLLWRFPPRRLEGEEVRDAMLFASGELNLEMGGPSFRPFEVENHGSDFYILKDRSEPPFNRRTIYRMNVNSGKSPLLDAFDCPDPSVKTPSRRVTTTPLQALALMNNPFVQRQASRLAERTLRECGGDPRPAARSLFRRALGRDPSPEEAEEALSQAREHGMESVAWVLFNSTEFLHVD